MKVVLLPGMDGTGKLFQPLLSVLPAHIEAQVICYPTSHLVSYEALIEQLKTELPDNEEYILIAESFSGPIGYAIAREAPTGLRAVIFVASFLSVPNRLLSFARWLPLTGILRVKLPTFLIKLFMLGSEANAEQIASLQQVVGEVPAEVLAYRLREMAKLGPAKEPLSLPCYYILANQDRLVSKHHVDDFKCVASDFHIIDIDGPHFILQIQPRVCAAEIARVAESFK